MDKIQFNKISFIIHGTYILLENPDISFKCIIDISTIEYISFSENKITILTNSKIIFEGELSTTGVSAFYDKYIELLTYDYKISHYGTN